MSNGMFLDKEMGMGIWTRHISNDGRVFYYNMKQNKSKWEYEFMDGSSQSSINQTTNSNTVLFILCRNDPIDQSSFTE